MMVSPRRPMHCLDLHFSWTTKDATATAKPLLTARPVSPELPEQERTHTLLSVIKIETQAPPPPHG